MDANPEYGITVYNVQFFIIFDEVNVSKYKSILNTLRKQDIMGLHSSVIPLSYNALIGLLEVTKTAFKV